MKTRPNPDEIRNFGDYLDRLNAQPTIADVEAHIGDWPNGRSSREALISYVRTHFDGGSILYQWACWAKDGGQ